MSATIEVLEARVAASKAEYDAARAKIITPQFPLDAPVSVTMQRDATVCYRGRGLVYKSLIWIIHAPYDLKDTIRDFGFIWDGVAERWWTHYSGDVVGVAQYCDSAALAALDEAQPDWRRYRADLVEVGE